MWISKLDIQDFRAFQEKCTIKLSKNVTVIGGQNGVGKSTILAILTNVGELSADYKTLFNSRFRGEFKEVIMYDKTQDTPGKKATATFEDIKNSNIPKHLSFTGHRQKDKYGMRYRLIPIKSKNYNSESKITWPTLYLGLSRLMPLGEQVAGKISPLPEKYSKKIAQVHNDILSENLDLNNVKSSNLDVGIKKPKSTIKTSNYGYASNSNGQDNTGQIIEGILSFERLKEELGSNYDGGIFAIDELDATLHPAAQNKMFDWLLEESKKLNLQIVFTTHSLTLLEHISKLQSIHKNQNSILINYLSTSSDAPGYVKVKENPDVNYYRHNLQEIYTLKPYENHKIKCFSEDNVARWYIKRLISLSNEKFPYLKYIDFLDIGTSWKSLLSILKSDPQRYKNDLFLLDPDLSVTKEPLSKYLKDQIFKYQINDKNANLFILPGTKTKLIEGIMRDYFSSCSSSNDFFNDPIIEDMGITYDKAQEIIRDHQSDKDKTWFYEMGESLLDIIIKFWYADNQDILDERLSLINDACARIYSNLND